MRYGYSNVLLDIENVSAFLANWTLFLLSNSIDCEYSRDGYFPSFISDCDYFTGDYINVTWTEEFSTRPPWDTVAWKHQWFEARIYVNNIKVIQTE